MCGEDAEKIQSIIDFFERDIDINKSTLTHELLDRPPVPPPDFETLGTALETLFVGNLEQEKINSFFYGEHFTDTQTSHFGEGSTGTASRQTIHSLDPLLLQQKKQHVVEWGKMLNQHLLKFFTTDIRGMISSEVKTKISEIINNRKLWIGDNIRTEPLRKNCIEALRTYLLPHQGGGKNTRKRNTRKRNTRKRNTRKRNTRKRNTRKRNTRKRNTRKKNTRKKKRNTRKRNTRKRNTRRGN